MALEDAPHRGLRDGHEHDDLRVGATLPTQSQHLALQRRGGAPGLSARHTGAFVDAFGKAVQLHPAELAAGGFLAHALEVLDHLRSAPRGELGVSVHVVRGDRQSVDDSSNFPH